MPIVPVFSSHAATVIRLTGSSLVGAPVYDTNFPSGENRPNALARAKRHLLLLRGPIKRHHPQMVHLGVLLQRHIHHGEHTHLPLGEICGSLTLFIAIRSAKVIGRLGAPFMTVSPSWVGFAAASPPSVPQPSPEPPPSRPTPTQSQPHASSSSRQSTSTRRSLPPRRSHPVPRKKSLKNPSKFACQPPRLPKIPITNTPSTTYPEK